ncbi:MAG: hypothetical protein WCL11_04275 [Verrucomicrobiota bacterium]
MTRINKTVHGGKTKAIALRIGSAALVVSDHAYPIPERPDSNGQLKYDATVSRVEIAHDVPEFCDESPDLVHCVAHTERAKRPDEFMKKFFDGTPAGKKVIIVHVASSPIPEEIKSEKMEIPLGPTFYWLSMKDRAAYDREPGKWLSEFLTLTAQQAEDLVNYGDRSDVPSVTENDCARFLDIILPRRIEQRLAFRLLCEAKEACGEQDSTELCGITIHAPKDLGEWLEPFGGSGAHDISRVAGMIGSGNIKAAAELVLKAVNENGHLSDAITNFLNVSESQNS